MGKRRKAFNPSRNFYIVNAIENADISLSPQ